MTTEQSEVGKASTEKRKPTSKLKVTRRYGAPGTVRVRRRHYLIAATFLASVALPTGLAGGYLWLRAADQYASYVGFLVRSEKASTSLESISGILNMGTSSSTDTDILYKFIQSRELVERVNKKLDLKSIWSKEPEDFFYSYRGDGNPEDLLRHWNRKVGIFYDQGMLDLRVKAFSPEDAKNIATAIFEESQRTINEINTVARQDTLLHAEDDLKRASARLKDARTSLSKFRSENQIVDAESYVSGQEGVVASLQQQLAEALIQLGMTRANAGPEDPRISQAQLRVEVIRKQISDERMKVGGDDTFTPGGGGTSDLVGSYEALQVDRQFAETAYTSALASYENARAEADRQALYLAPYMRPTEATISEYPEKLKILATLAGFLTLAWLIGVMTFYSLRDRR